MGSGGSSDPARARNTSRALPAVSAQRPLSVGVVDAVPLYRDGISALFDRTPWLRLAAHCASQHGALQMTERLRPDVLVLDSGLDPLGHLLKLLAGTPTPPRVVVLVRKANENARYLANAMACGAHGAVPRAAEPQRVLEAIRHAHQSRHYLDPALTNLITRSNDGTPPAQRGQSRAPAQLSRREYQVLELIAEGLENAAIAKVLFLSVETVRTHVKGILRKLNARDRTHAVTIAFRGGLLAMTPEHNPVTTAVVPPRAPDRGVV